MGSRTTPAEFWRHIVRLIFFATLLLSAGPVYAAISSSGDVSPNPSATTDSSTFYIGRAANGMMTVDAGSDVVSGTSYLGYDAGGSGVATISGNGSTWNTRGLTVARFGSGNLTIIDGGKVNSSISSSIGSNAGSLGTVNVSGANSQWTVELTLTVGNQGTGRLTVADSGVVSSVFGDVGGLDGSGEVTISGPGSRWLSSSSIDVGDSSIGTLTISDGGLVSTDSANIGRGADGVGSVAINDPSSTWRNTGNLSVGDSGRGTLTIHGGLADVGRDTFVGRSSSGVGTIRFNNGTLRTGGLLTALADLEGTGTVHTNGLVSDIALVFDQNNGLQKDIVVANEPDQNVTIHLNVGAAGSMGAGHRGQGSLTIADGLDISSRDGYLGYHSTANGVGTIDGAGSTWTLGGNLYVGYRGTGTLNISNGGVVAVADSTYAGRSANSASRIQLQNGTLRTESLWASPSQLGGAGAVNTHGLVSDIDLVFDESHPLQRQLTFNSEPNQNVTIYLDVDGSGAIGAGYYGEGSLTISGGMTVASASGYLGFQSGSKGTATVTGEEATWTINGELVVGQSGMGDLRITAGGAVSNAIGRLSHGKVTVSGPGSTWTSTGSLSVGSFVNTTAELLIENGGRVISNSSPGSSGFDSGIGVFILSKGIVNVTGAGSTWTHNASLNVGGQGTGTLSISNGGRVVSLGGVVSTGSPFGGGVGTSSATVSGPGSTWVNNGPLTVGSGLPGTLTIADGGHVSSTSGFIASQSFSNGAASVTGNGSAWTISDDLIVGGSSTSISGGAGTLSIGPGSNVSVGDQIVIHQQGQLKLEGGSLAATAIRRGPFGLGLFNWTAGTLHVGSFEGSLTNSAGILAPGRSPGSTTITGDYTQQAGGALEIEIGGTLPGTGYDAVSVNLRATLGGQLQLALIGGFVPGQANIFTVLMANTGLTGAFANVANGQRLATSDGTGSFLVHYGATSAFNPRHVVLTNFQSTLLPGDFNHDGNVDAADYVVWRRNPSGNTLVDTTNYNTWRANFGRTAAQVASATSVPEPESFAFVGALLSVVVFTRARRY